jgi:hypothetical protein
MDRIESKKELLYSDIVDFRVLLSRFSIQIRGLIYAGRCYATLGQNNPENRRKI